MDKLYTTCMELKSITGTKDKKAFLETHKDDIDFIALLKFLLNPRIVTGISKAKLNKKVPVARGLYFLGIEDLYNYLENNNTGRDIDIAMCQGYISRFPEHKDFISSIITKTLKLGVDAKTCNAVYGNDFIHLHEVQQGSPRDKLRLKNGEIFYLQEKLNGIRASFINGKLISRQGTEFIGLDHIINELKKLNKAFSNEKINYVFDGELIRKNNDNISDNQNFRLTTSLVNSDDKDKSDIELVIFDILPIDEFDNGESKDNYDVRRKLMDEMQSHIEECLSEYHNIRFVPIWYCGSNQSMIDYWLEYAETHNMEGAMLNKIVPYYCKRHTGLIKIKAFKHSDLRIIGYEEGTNKYKEMLGAIIVDYKGNEVNVGSGFTDEQRKEFWENKKELIGKIAQIKYKDESSSEKTGLKSLQFPIFEMLRDDKTEVSYE